MSNPKTYKWCIVPKCVSTTVSSPEKLFFVVPYEVKMRKKWMRAIKRDNPPSNKSCVYCCEDHFDIEQDAENLLQYKLGYSASLRLKRGVVPHKFCLNKKIGDKEALPRTVIEKLKRAEVIQRIFSQDYSKLRPVGVPEEVFLKQESGPSQNLEPEDVDAFVRKRRKTSSSAVRKKSDSKELSKTDDITIESEPSDLLEEAQDSDPLQNNDLEDRDDATDNVVPSASVECCDHCHEEIQGCRYVCVQCARWQTCGACDARGHHAAHYVLRAPAFRPHDEVQMIVQKVRQAIIDNNALVTDNAEASASDIIDMEVPAIDAGMENIAQPAPKPNALRRQKPPSKRKTKQLSSEIQNTIQGSNSIENNTIPEPNTHALQRKPNVLGKQKPPKRKPKQLSSDIKDTSQDSNPIENNTIPEPNTQALQRKPNVLGKQKPPKRKPKQLSSDIKDTSQDSNPIENNTIPEPNTQALQRKPNVLGKQKPPKRKPKQLSSDIKDTSQDSNPIENKTISELNVLLRNTPELNRTTPKPNTHARKRKQLIEPVPEMPEPDDDDEEFTMRVSKTVTVNLLRLTEDEIQTRISRLPD